MKCDSSDAFAAPGRGCLARLWGGGQGPPRVPSSCPPRGPQGQGAAGLKPQSSLCSHLPWDNEMWDLPRGEQGLPGEGAAGALQATTAPWRHKIGSPPPQDRSDQEPAPQPPPLQHPGWALPSPNSLLGSCKCLYAPKAGSSSSASSRRASSTGLAPTSAPQRGVCSPTPPTYPQGEDPEAPATPKWCT